MLPRDGRSTHRAREARAAHEREREQEVERDHAARRVVLPIEKTNRTTISPTRGDDDRLQDRLEVLLVDEPPQLRVEPNSAKIASFIATVTTIVSDRQRS
jgi:hypothetical protein